MFTYVHKERNLLPFRLFLTSISVSGMWAGRVGSSPRIARGVVLPHAEISFTLLPAGMCSSLSADEWWPWNCLAPCGFFHSSEINQSSAWKAALHHTCMVLWHYQDGFCLSSSQCIAWRQRYVIPDRCNLALQSCFMQKQEKVFISITALLWNMKKAQTNQPDENFMCTVLIKRTLQMFSFCRVAYD